MKKLNLIRTADVKEYISLLDREEITMSRFAEILNECANEALRINDVVGQRGQFISMLPSDDEIIKAAEENASKGEWYATHNGFIDGADFVIDKLITPDVAEQSEQLVCSDCSAGRDEFAPEWECPKCRDKDYTN